MKRLRTTTFCALAMWAASASAGTIGRMVPAEPLTEALVRTLPTDQQAPWLAYLGHSRAAMAQDKAALASERDGVTPPPGPSAAHPGSGMPLNRDAAWYAGPQALRVADNIVSFQTPAGAWGKNVDRDGPTRERGQAYVLGEDVTYVGTIDNDATTTELRFLARVQAALPVDAGRAYRDAFAKGIRYLLDAQYPNGGFPQIYPIEGSYHDAITLNDDAMLNAVSVLADAASRRGDFAFVPADLAAAAGAAANRAIHLLLAMQIKVDGQPTGWAQQYDVLNLMPAGARNFEPIALSSGETANLLMFLMGLPDPPPDVTRAVHAGAAWLARVKLRDVEWKAPSAESGRLLLPSPGAGPLWSRYYDIATMRPIFGDRDRSIHDDISEISKERRNGYSWFGNGPAKTLARYQTWAQRHPRKPE